MNSDSDGPANKYRSDAAVRNQQLRDRRKQAGVVQVSFWLHGDDAEEAKRLLAPLLDRAWLAMFDAGAIQRRDDPARAEEVRKRLGVKGLLPTQRPPAKDS